MQEEKSISLLWSQELSRRKQRKEEHITIEYLLLKTEKNGKCTHSLKYPQQLYPKTVCVCVCVFQVLFICHMHNDYSEIVAGNNVQKKITQVK